jgi:branched-subunit amino acid transport protein
MSYSNFSLWTIILALGIGTYLIRFSFLGLLGNRQLPEWLLRHLRYAPMAVLPALVAPLVLWPAGNDGHPEPARLLATAATIAAGYFTRNTLAAIGAGLGSLYFFLWLFGG